MKDALSRLIRDIEGLPKSKTSDMYTTGTRPLHALLGLQQFDAPWGRNLLPRRMLSNAEGELPCWYPFATGQFRLGLSYDLIPRLAAGGSAAICG